MGDKAGTWAMWDTTWLCFFITEDLISHPGFKNCLNTMILSRTSFKIVKKRNLLPKASHHFLLHDCKSSSLQQFSHSLACNRCLFSFKSTNHSPLEIWDFYISSSSWNIHAFTALQNRVVKIVTHGCFFPQANTSSTKYKGSHMHKCILTPFNLDRVDSRMLQIS